VTCGSGAGVGGLLCCREDGLMTCCSLMTCYRDLCKLMGGTSFSLSFASCDVSHRLGM